MRSLCVVLVLAAGCGKVLHATPDGGGGGGGGGGGDSGGMGDGSSSDPTVYLTVLTTDYSGQPDGAAIAVFQDQTGAVVRDGLVAADGTAQAALPMGGMVTVIDVTMNGNDRTVEMKTIEDVKPGDHLTVGSTRAPTNFTGAQTTMTATFTPFASNWSHNFTTSCGEIGGTVVAGAPSTAQLNFVDSCHGATFDLLSVAADPSAPPDYRYVYQSGLPYAANGNLAVPNTWTGMNTFAVTMTNTPSDLSEMLVTHSTYMGEIDTAGDSVELSSPAPGVNSASLQYPPVGTGALVQIGLYSTQESGQQLYENRTSSVTSSLGVDMSKLQLPWVGVPGESVTGVSWDQIDGGTPDARFVTWDGRWTDSNGVLTNLAWEIEDGKADHSITLPTLPASYAMYDPAMVTSTVTPTRGSVVYVDYANLDGYDQARAYGPNLTDSLSNLGVFVDQPIERRASHPPLVARQ